MFHFSEAENTQDRILEVHQTILERLGDSLPFVPQIAGHLLEEKKELLRSRMTVRCAELFKPVDDRIFDLAGILEFLHASSLLHRQVRKPGEARRQLKPIQGIWGNEASVLLGDYLLSISFEILTGAGNLEILETISTTTQNIALGQMQEVSQPFADSSPETWEKITQLKHASLFRAGAVCASIWGEASPHTSETLGKFGFELGMASLLQKDLETVCDHDLMIQAIQKEKVLYPMCLWLEKGLEPGDSKRVREILSNFHPTPEFLEKDWKELLSWCWIPVQQKIEAHLELARFHLDQLDDLECSNLRKLTEFETQPVPQTIS